MNKAVAILLWYIAIHSQHSDAEFNEYYPDLRCHTRFNQNLKGQDFLQQSMKECNSFQAKSLPSPFRCYKSCVLMMLGVVTETDNDILFASESDIADVVKNTLLVGHNDNAGENIAENLISNCSNLMNEISKGKVPCENWGDFLHALRWLGPAELSV